MSHQQPPVSEVTCKAAAALASSAAGVIVDGNATEDQRAEAARLLRAAADMLAPVRLGQASCRCSPMRGGVTTYTVNTQAGDIFSDAATRALRSATGVVA